MRRLRLIAMTLAACVITSCSPADLGTDASDPAPWATRAEEWQEARAVIGDSNPIHVMRFYAPDARFRDYAYFTRHGGDPPVPTYMTLAMWGQAPSVNGLYLSRDGILLDYLWSDVGWAIPFLEANDVTALGITKSVMADVATERNILDPAHDRVEHLLDAVRRHAEFWAGDEAASPYAADAAIVDSLRSVRLASVDVGIDPDLAERLRLPGSSIVELPNGQGRAIFIDLAGPSDDALDSVYALVESDDGSGCPGAMAVELRCRNGWIVRETRYHEVSAARRCIEDELLTGGWWDDVDIPESSDPLLTAVATSAHDEVVIPIYDGTMPMVDLVEWAMGRFSAAGLETPVVASVTFADESTERCQGGIVGHASGGADITLCVNPWLVTSNVDLERLLLHEFAHVWIDEYLDADAKDRFMDHVKATGWANPEFPWHERGVEQAANAVMYGLIDDVETFDLIDAPYDQAEMCRIRKENFEILTGRTAIAPCIPPAGE